MRMSMWRPLVIAMVLALALGSVVVYADKPESGDCGEEHCHGDGNGTGSEHDIEAENFNFQPDPFETSPDTVIWLTVEGKHNVTICPVDTDLDGNNNTCLGEPIHSEDIKSGKTTSFNFGAIGTYNYFCRFHGPRGMVGSVDVLP